jgi:septal ring factor EnvC (AmiA/AmiB activator)
MSSEWLGDLEQRVSAAVEEIERLREDNEALRGELLELRARAGSTAETAWAAEREEVRARVEKLVGRLEELLVLESPG